MDPKLVPTVPTLVNNAAGHPVLLVPVALETPRPSSTGKTLIVGQVAGGYGPAVDPATGKPIRINLTAMVKL